jgi:hypothetical protein
MVEIYHRIRFLLVHFDVKTLSVIFDQVNIRPSFVLCNRSAEYPQRLFH